MILHLTALSGKFIMCIKCNIYESRELEDRADTKDNSLLAAARRIGAANQLKAYRLFLGR